MKKHSLFITAVILAALFSGCSFHKNVPETLSFSNKSVILPADTGTKTLPLTGFITTKDLWSKYQTEVTLQRTENGLNIQFLCYWNQDNAVWAEKKPDDNMDLFGGEHIEFQLSPNGLRDGIYYHFAINPAGSIYHAKKTDKSWTPQDFSYDIEMNKNFWKLSCNLPYSTLEQNSAPEPDAKWKVNFCRAGKEKNSPAEDSSWTGSTNYHDIAFMGDLLFSGNPPSQQLKVFRCSSNQNGELEFELAQTGNEKGYLQIYDQGNFLCASSLNTDQRSVVTCKLKSNYVNLKGLRKISLYYFGQLRTPVQTFTGTVKTEQEEFLLPDKMEYINADSMKCTVSSVPGKLTIKTDDSTVREKEITENDQAEISLKDLNPGRYIIEYASKGKRSSRVFFIANTPIPEPEAYPENAVLSAKGKDLFLNGKPYYLFGVSEGNAKLFPVKPGYSYSYGPGARKNAVAIQGFPIANLTFKPIVGRVFAENWEELTIQHLERSKKSQRPLWRKISYEANLPAFLKQKDGSLLQIPDGHKMYEKVYKIAKQMIPDALFILHVDNISSVRDFAPICDVLEYATWKSSYHPDNMMLYFQQDLKYIQMIAGNKPVIPWLGGSVPNAHCRSAEEIRAGVYATILNGGAGNTVHMGHDGVPADRTRFWSMLSMIQREIDSFYGDLKTWNPVKMNFPENTIGKTVISPDGELLTVLLNTTLTELNVSLELPKPYGKKNLILTPLEPRILRVPLPEQTETPAPATTEKK